jgi:hypothetical protein
MLLKRILGTVLLEHQEDFNMPNWVYNRLTAKPHVIDACLDKDRKVSFETISPLPTALSSLSKHCGNHDLIKAYASYINDHDDSALQKLYSYPIYNSTYKTFEDFCSYVFSEVSLKDLSNYLSVVSTYGADNWYDWCCKNWGTKWDASSDFIEDSGYPEDVEEIEFQTAWSPPEAWFAKLVRKFPSEKIYMHFDEESCAFSGSFNAFGSGSYMETTDKPEYYTPYVLESSEFDDYLKDFSVETVEDLDSFLKESLPEDSYTVNYTKDSSGFTASIDVVSDDYSYTKTVEHLKEVK